ncbi:MULTISPECIES: DUF3429 domain-containing protein [unclassified Thioalkalivibrio]|uniref:DUF3429 domain-containing protein n=1 Tax=unclassified Thioalkalivibrio TaxID=2621013 RepID=UPI0018CA7193|nr:MULTISPECIES: DUF3429 domain-containing protein [unclassified Thioalkalivibrio]
MEDWPQDVRDALVEHEIVAVTSGLSDMRDARALLDAMVPGRWVCLEWGMASAHNRAQFHALREATGADVLPFFVARDRAIGGLPELREYLGARAVAAGAHRGSRGDVESSSLSRPVPDGSAPILQVLGYAGLVPFLVLGVGAWMAQPEWQAFALEALAFYGAVILSFLGAIHWGLYLADRSHRVGPLAAPVWAVVPAILAWLALLQPLPEALMTLAALFLGVLWVDRFSLRERPLPRGYMSLRLVLTAGAIVSLASGLAVIMGSTD